MPTVLFIHGTGVRRESFAATFEVVRRQLLIRNPNCSVRPCYWGDLGAKLHFDGKSIPDYASARYTTPPAELIFWSSLYDDPLLELRQLAMPNAQETGVAPPPAPSARLIIDAIASFSFQGDLKQQLETLGQFKFWSDAFNDIQSEPDLERAFGVGRDAEIVLHAFSRAIAALAISRTRNLGLPTPDAVARDSAIAAFYFQLDNAIKDYEVQLGSPVRRSLSLAGRALTGYYSDYISGPAKRYATHVSTKMFTQRAVDQRRSFADFSSPIAGDILVYQARGKRIRDEVASAISQCQEPPHLIAHSLGGIIAIDLLASPSPPIVSSLITIGSQAPYLYEMGALVSCPPERTLPGSFPRWLNVYDPNDLLSFRAQGVFPGMSSDLRIESDQPFPQSHGAYWSSSQMWAECVKFINAQ